MKNIERKQDTRRKIQLGGLIKKANLDGETTAVLYGLLLDAQEKLTGDDSPAFRQEWQIKGVLSQKFLADVKVRSFCIGMDLR